MHLVDTLGDRPRLVAIAGPLCGEVLPLNGEDFTIGRDPSNRVALADLSLSRRHCFIATMPAPHVRDMGSSNGTFVNGMQVTDHLLRDGDRLQVGESVFVFVSRGGPVTSATPGEREPSGPATIRLPLEDARYLRREPAAPLTDPARRAQALHALVTISTDLNAATTEAEIHRLLLNSLSETVPSELVAIVSLDDGIPVVVQPSDPASAAEILASPVLRQALDEMMGVRTRDEIPSRLCVPIARSGRVIGAIYMAAAGGQAFDDEHLHLVAAIAGIAAIVIEQARRVARLEDEAARLRSGHVEHNLVGRSPSMARVYNFVARVAPLNVTVLITGETGTGKELVARAIHANSPRAQRPFIAVNCAALTETLLESELFGHERGAFTGAVSQKKGRFELADGGTLFLDEIGELAPALQSKLLRVLQEHEFERVGGTRTIRSDVRLISATNRVLTEEVAARRFREDLYHRVNIVPIQMPPLRERREDIPQLAQHFIGRMAAQANRHVDGLSHAALRALMHYDWPGNVRELENALQHAIALGASATIELDDLPESIIENGTASAGPSAGLHEAVRETKIRAIREAFRQAGRSYTEAAHLLGVHPNYLHRLIRNLDLKQSLEEDR
jgi:transcriptional regulator with GAF, ATPase, and Fis domain